MPTLSIIEADTDGFVGNPTASPYTVTEARRAGEVGEPIGTAMVARP